MHKLYQEQLNVAKKLASEAEKLSYSTSILRSVLQTLSLSALEISTNSTPNFDNDVSINKFLDRFSQPSDGLPIEIIDSVVPVIRSLVSPNYMKGWFEKVDGYEDSLVSSLTDWVSFRNKKPGHGVLDAPTTKIWADKTINLITRILSSQSELFPLNYDGKLVVKINELNVPISIQLIQHSQPIVIGKIVPTNSSWKLQGHILSWESATEITLNLSASNIFSNSRLSGERFKWAEVPIPNGSTLLLNNLPAKQTSIFVGREKEKQKLNTWLENIQDSRACLVFGDGGFGKTTLVLEFFNNLLENGIDGDFNLPTVISFYTAKKTKWTEEGLVHFKGISGAMEDSIRELVYCIEPVLGKEWYKSEGKQLIDKVANRFADEGFTRDDILLIIDNTETLATSTSDTEELANFISQVARKIGRVVITSRRHEVLNAEPIPVSQLTESDAIKLIRDLGEEYSAFSIQSASERTLRNACKQLLFKPLLIDTLVKYIARSSSGVQNGLDQILKKTNDELLEFLYEDAWARMNDLVQEVFMVLVSLSSELDGKCVGDVCKEVGVQHAEFQASLGETYFATIVNHGESYDLEIVDLANKFFHKKKQKISEYSARKLNEIALIVDSQSVKRHEINENYRTDRVADAFRSDFAKQAKMASIKQDYKSADEYFQLALLDEPLNAALKERYASFLLRYRNNAPSALNYVKEATDLDPHNADAWLTTALIQYQLRQLKEGDEAIKKAQEFGKSESLCLLRKAIARYHHARIYMDDPQSPKLLKDAETFITKSKILASNKELFYLKNMRETDKYSAMIRALIIKINSKLKTK